MSTHLHLLHVHLLLSQELSLASHQKLLFLLATFQVILLFGGQSCAKAWKCTSKWWLNSTRLSSSWTSRSRGECSTSWWRRWAMWNSDLRNKEGLSRIANASDQLAKGFKFRIFKFSDREICRKE